MFWLMDAVYVLAAESRPNEPHGTVEEQVCAIRHTESQYDVLFSDGDVVKYLFPKTYNQLGTPQTSEAALGIDDWLRFWWLFEGIFHSPAEDDAESAALNMLACDQAVREADRAKLAIVIYYMITDEPETAPLS